VLRLLLTDNSVWGRLSAEDHGLLCDLPSPYGEIFTWLDHQYMEYGSQNWASIRLAIGNEPFGALCIQQIANDADRESEFSETEVQFILKKELLRKLQKELEEKSSISVLTPEDTELRAYCNSLSSRISELRKVPSLV
jgi:DNA primase